MVIQASLDSASNKNTPFYKVAIIIKKNDKNESDSGEMKTKVVHSSYIEFGFVNIFVDEMRKPHCTICKDISASEAMKPSKFKWNFLINHYKKVYTKKI